MKSISQSEAEVLKILWCNSPLDALQITTGINNPDWSPVTVKTLINRLLKKGYLGFSKQGRSYLYHPTITQKEYQQDENQSFITRMYNGKLSSLIAAFSNHENLNKNEIGEIRALLNSMEENDE